MASEKPKFFLQLSLILNYSLTVSVGLFYFFEKSEVASFD